MRTSDLKAIVAGMTEAPWHVPGQGWLADAVIAGGDDVTIDGDAHVVVRANTHKPYHGNLAGIAALRNHADALVGLLEAVEQVLAASGPEDYVATRRALLTAYARVMAVP